MLKMFAAFLFMSTMWPPPPVIRPARGPRFSCTGFVRGVDGKLIPLNKEYL